MELTSLKDAVEGFSKCQQLDVLRILVDSKVAYDENQNGVFVNLSHVSPEGVAKIKKYVEYANLQTSTLAQGEEKRQEIKGQFFT